MEHRQQRLRGSPRGSLGGQPCIPNKSGAETLGGSHAGSARPQKILDFICRARHLARPSMVGQSTGVDRGPGEGAITGSPPARPTAGLAALGHDCPKVQKPCQIKPDLRCASVSDTDAPCRSGRIWPHRLPCPLRKGPESTAPGPELHQARSCSPLKSPPPTQQNKPKASELKRQSAAAPMTPRASTPRRFVLSSPPDETRYES